MKKFIRLISAVLLIVTTGSTIVSCSGKIPSIFSYEDYGLRVDENTDFASLDLKYLEQVKDNWRLMLVGTEKLNDKKNDTIKAKLESIDKAASSAWTSMNTGENRTALWGNKAYYKNDNLTLESQSMKDREQDVSSDFSKLLSMAKGYATPGSSYYQNKKLLADIKSGLDFMFNEVYGYYILKYNYVNSAYRKEYANTEYAAPAGSTGKAPWGGNWWEWDIGAPRSFTEIFIMLEDELDQDLIAEYLSYFDYGNYLPHMTIANRVWIGYSVLGSAALQGDSYRFWYALRQMDQVFDYVDIDKLKSGELVGDEKDGFYEDGSFVQHGAFPYTAGYGLVMIGDLSSIIQITSGTAFELPTDLIERQVFWLYDSYQTLCYNGASFSNVAGRGISRGVNEIAQGRSIFTGLIIASTYSNITENDKLKLLSIAKYYAKCNPETDYISSLPIYMVSYTQKVIKSKKVKPREEYNITKIFSQMDRVVYHGENFGATVSLSSKRIYKYESINYENMKGWYTGDSVLYIYTNNNNAFGKEFWLNVDMYRLPGITVTTSPRKENIANAYFNPSDFAGGVSVGKYGISVMQLAPFTSKVKEETFSSTLEAKKSYFFFDDEIVALGTDIFGDDKNGYNIITMIDNRIMTSTGKITVNGINTGISNNKSAGDQKNNVSYIYFHEFGGYYFPKKTTVFTQISTGTESFLQLWLNHGRMSERESVENKSYEVVYLPNMSEKNIEKYAKSPDVSILSNTHKVQAVSDKSTGTVGYVFWEAGKLGGVEVDNACAVMTLNESKDTFKLSLSDTSQTLDSLTVTVTLPSSGMSVKSSANNVSVSLNGTTATITVDLSTHYGWSYDILFEK